MWIYLFVYLFIYELLLRIPVRCQTGASPGARSCSGDRSQKISVALLSHQLGGKHCGKEQLGNQEFPNSGLTVTGWVGKGMGDVGVGAEPPGSRAWSGIKVVAYTHVPGWDREQPLFSVGSECAVCSLNYGPGRAKISGKFVAFCCGFFCLDAGAAALSCPRMFPPPLPAGHAAARPFLGFLCACSDGEQRSGMLWSLTSCWLCPCSSWDRSWIRAQRGSRCLRRRCQASRPPRPLVFPGVDVRGRGKNPIPQLQAASEGQELDSQGLEVQPGFFFGFWCCHVLLSRDPVGSEATCPKSEWCHVCVAERGVLGLLLHYKFQVCHMLQSTGFSFHFGSPRARLPSFRPPRPLCCP